MDARVETWGTYCGMRRPTECITGRYGSVNDRGKRREKSRECQNKGFRFCFVGR